MRFNYSQLLQKLYNVNLFGGVKLGLENSFMLDQALNSPSKSMRFIHVAGTNGKGSVSTKIAKGLEAAGFRTGLYTSPHLCSFRERIRINGSMIPEESIEDLLPQIFDIAKNKKLKPTFFEYATLLAFMHFQKEQVDFAVLETGLGGRLDATNIVHPELSVITSISLEHTEILGTTIEAITHEKGGIIKPGVPVLIGPHVPYTIIRDIAKAQNSSLIQIKETFDTFEQENRAIAEAALIHFEIEKMAIDQGLSAIPSCRMETLEIGNTRIIFDVAHNPDGLNRLFKVLKLQYPHKKPGILFGLSKSKDIDGCLSIITENGSAFYPVEASNGRGISIVDLRAFLLQKGIPSEKILYFKTIEESISNAFIHHDLIIVCGTFFIMGQVKRALKIIEPFDEIDMNEK